MTKCLIIYSGQSRFLDTSIRLHSLATEKFSNMQFDVMLSTWQEDTSEKDIQALKEWKHGETYIRMPMHNDWADYNPKVKVYNGMKMLLSKSIALNYVLDLPNKYDIIILTRTDYHVPCISPEDFSFLSRVYKNTLKNMTSVFDGQYCWKMTGWELLINDNFVVMPANLVYSLDKTTITNITTEILEEAYEHDLQSGHIFMFKFLASLHNISDTSYRVKFDELVSTPQLFRSSSEIEQFCNKYI